MSAIIISAYPACGKTTYFNKHSKYAKGKGTRKILDSDSSKFSWVYDEDGNKTDERDPNFPNNYIEHIKENILDADLVVWDEIGTKAVTQFEHEHLLSLINNRIEYNKAQILRFILQQGT